jgi:hypothetical protein
MRRLLVLGLVGVLAAACEVRTEVSVDVRESGSGMVEVAVGLDADAVERLPDLDSLVRVADLEDAGWTVIGPDPNADGMTWFRLTKPFATAEEATAILEEISGPDGPFQDLRLTRERFFGRTDFEFEGTVDLTGGLAAFSDAALAASLEGQPLGEPIEQIEQRMGAGAAEVFLFELGVRLPGEMESNAPDTVSGSAIWRPSLADAAPTDVAATSRTFRRGSFVALAVAGAAVLLLAIWLVVHVARRRHRRRREPDSPDPAEPTEPTEPAEPQT